MPATAVSDEHTTPCLPDHQWVRNSGRCIALEHDGDTEFLKVKQVECALAVEIENAQIIGFTSHA